MHSEHLVLSYQEQRLIGKSRTWMMHCHIIWHASQGLAMQFVERGTEIEATLDSDLLDDVCEAWNVYTPTELYVQDDSGI